ncbi:GNAT family N-acetyltransferase [Paenibacillus sp. P96]|uniref:GNAT family N-acetyltransferase n=1 Tax=Paenibacillus zeirhizosphaerae TaxID=2987519 RepID=A0ABT9FX83_9BACL|nr:GNAT family protein [Paenibacillus sp. P96]MDP4099245.1 GNAT family N-acetyltransferase [Paenibacillus sp. P96]
MSLTLYNTAQGIFLRPLRMEDAQVLLDLRCANKDFLAPFEPLREESFFTLEGQQQFLLQRIHNEEAGGGYQFGIFVVEDERLIGTIAISNIVRGVAQYADVGYMMDQSEQGKGHMTAAVKMIIQYSFKALGLHRLQAATLLHNKGSQKVLKKAGFQEEGIARRMLRIHGEWQDHRRYGILAEDLMEEAYTT